MRVACIWREASDYGRTVREWLAEFERRTGVEIESLDPDSPEGESLCRAYDIVEYPTIIAIDNHGKTLEMWRGQMLPRFDEVNYWVMQ